MHDELTDTQTAGCHLGTDRSDLKEVYQVVIQRTSCMSLELTVATKSVKAGRQLHQSRQVCGFGSSHPRWKVEVVVPLVHNLVKECSPVTNTTPSDRTSSPKEELAKLLAKSGTADGKAQAEAIEAASRIQSDNIGHKLLSQMGLEGRPGAGVLWGGGGSPCVRQLGVWWGQERFGSRGPHRCQRGR